MTPDLPATDAPELHYIQANGLEFAYLQSLPATDAQSAPLVLVLHGFPDTAWSFADLLQRLSAAGYRAVAPFMRGYPPSEIPEDGDYSIPALGRDVIALIEHFAADRAYVVGHDWGAIASYAAAALRPDRIRAIVTAAVPHLRRFLLRPTRAQIAASHYIFKFQLPWWAERRLPEQDFAWLADLARSWSPGWVPTDAYLQPLKLAFSDPARLKAAIGYYRALPGTLLTRTCWQFLLQPIQTPARVIRAENDGCILRDMFTESEHLFGADYELVEMKGVGHFMGLEDPAGFAALVLEFLKRH